MAKKGNADRFSDEEAQRRFEATLRGALKTPPSKDGRAKRGEEQQDKPANKRRKSDAETRSPD